MNKEIRTESGNIIKVDRFLNFIDEAEYLATAGNDVYIKCSFGNYRLIQSQKTAEPDKINN